MASLSPQIEISATAQGRQQGPSSFQAIGGLIQQGLKMATPEAGSSSGPSQSDINAGRDEALYREFGRQLGRAQDLRLAGREDEALRLESRVSTEFVIRGGSLEDDRAKSLVTQMTGRPENFTPGMSQEEFMQQQVMETPEYQGFFFGTYASHPTATDAERQEIALGQVAMSQATAGVIAESAHNWTAASGPAYTQKIIEFNTLLQGGLAMIRDQGGSVSLTDIQTARAEFNSFRANMVRPPNVTDAQWAPIATQLSAVESNLEYLEKLAGRDNVDATLGLAMVEQIQSVEGITELEKNALARMILADPSLYSQMGVLPIERVVELMRSVEDQAPMNPNIIYNPNATFSPVEFPEGSSPSDNLTKAVDNFVVAGLMGQNLSTNREARVAWGGQITQSLRIVDQLHKEGEWLTTDKYNEMFNEEFFSDMLAAREADPRLYDAIKTRAGRSLDQVGVMLGSRLESVTRDTALVYRDDGQFGYTQDSVRTYLDREYGDEPFRGGSLAGKQEGDPRTAFEVLDGAVERVYGGDYRAFSADKGRAFATEGEWEAAGLVEDFPEADSNQQELMNSVMVVASLRTRLSGLDTEREELSNDVRGALISGPNPATGDIRTTSLGPRTGAAPLIELVDRTEGGGNYDTLFGHSQREGNQFAGVRVSTMTIGELKEFSGARGQGSYGAWVKGANPEGVLATPMGRYQFVGTTLKATAEAMGLSDDVVFTPEVQDTMFAFKVQQRLSSASSQEGKRNALRAEWAGFKHVSDSDLDRAIQAFESGEPVSMSDFETRESRTGLSRPLARPPEFTSSRTAPEIASTRPQARPTESNPISNVEDAVRQAQDRVNETTAISRAGEEEASKFTALKANEAAISRLIQSGIQEYTEQEVRDAMAKGELQEGELIIIDGQVVLL